jgi:hypothetical protein
MYEIEPFSTVRDLELRLSAAFGNVFE